MAIRIGFDGNNTPETPTIVLATKNGTKLGVINTIENLVITDNFNGASEISFTVYKSLGEKECTLWDEIVDFKLLWCKEWDRWFEIETEVCDDGTLYKHVTAYTLGVYELSQINIYDMEVNTEQDILRPDYNAPTVLYDSINPNNSLIHRVLSKAPHYTIGHVDSSISRIQRSFSFNGESIVDVFNAIAEEIGCIFVYDAISGEDGVIERKVSVYDLEQTCLDCGYRGDYSGVCPKCGGSNITSGYGEDTNIFISPENLTDEINYQSNTGEVKNCFRLSAGDDLMTSVIMSCNPSGNNYLWLIPDYQREEMSNELQSKLNEYDILNKRYTAEESYSLDNQVVNEYNRLIQKYVTINSDLNQTENSIVGFSSLVELLYNAYDFETYLQTRMMPYIEPEEQTAATQAALLTETALSPIALSTLNQYTSLTTVESALKVAIRLIINTGSYSFSVNSSSWSNNQWVGTITVFSRTNETDICETNQLTILVNDNYIDYTKQLIEKKAKSADTDKYSVSSVLSMIDNDMADAINLYSLDCLNGIYSCCQDIINILIEAGGGTPGTQLYTDLYTNYYSKLNIIQSEIDLRSSEISAIVELENNITGIRNSIMDVLDFEKFLGADLWVELNTFRREQEYKNDNYISDGLSNSDLIKNALEFLDRAKNELYKSAMLQHSITATLNNLLTIKEFESIIDYFSVGNWLTVKINDELFRLRLLSYEIDYESVEKIQVEFSDVKQISTGMSDLESVVAKANSIASAFSYVSRQATSGADSKNILENWVENGLAVTNAKIIGAADNQNMVWDGHGLLFRRLEPITEIYDQEQLKIINSTIAITDDEWQSVKTAIGKFFYYDPTSNSYKSGYGINGETIVGKLILGEALGIYNTSGSLTFNKNGLSVSNTNNSVVINPNSMTLFRITKGEDNLLSVDSSGNLHINGEVTASSGTIAGFTIGSGAIRYGDFDSVADSSIALSSTSDFSRVINGSSKSNLRFAIGGKFGIAKDGTMYASGGNFSGSISTGNKTSAGTQSNGLYIDSNGNLYAGNGNLTRIFSDGTFSFGGVNGINYSNNKVVLGSNCSIQWTSVSGTGTVITESSLRTVNVTADNLTVKAANISGKITASQINTSGLTADAIVANATITGPTITGASITADNLTVKNNIYIYDSADGYNGRKNCIQYSAGVLWFNQTVGFDKDFSINDTATFANNGIRIYANSSNDPIIAPWTNHNSDSSSPNHLGYCGTSSQRWDSVYCDAGSFNTSDKKEKDHIMYLKDNVLLCNFIYSLNPAMYTLKHGTGKRRHMGLYAQDVAQLADRTIGDIAAYRASIIGANGEELYYDDDASDENMIWGLNYAEFIAPIIAVLQIQKNEINQLSERIHALESN